VSVAIIPVSIVARSIVALAIEAVRRRETAHSEAINDYISLMKNAF
jgi:hypothetical protein